jgi:hypothetical protein
MFGFFRRRKRAEDFLCAAAASEPERPAEVEAIRGCRELFGPPPRSLPAPDAHAFRLALPARLEGAF